MHHEVDTDLADPVVCKAIYIISSDDGLPDKMRSVNDKEQQDDLETEIGVSPKRFVILGLFVLYSLSNAFQWIEYAIITNIIAHFYDVSNLDVNWTSVVFMVVYIPLIFPASWLLDKKGLRCVVILGSFGTCLGAWVKCFSISPDRYYVTMIGQTIVAVSQIFILSIPPRLAAVWFPAKSVSRACAVGVFGNQLGIALGFLLPPHIVPNSSDKDEIAHGLRFLFYGVSIFCSVLFVAILIVFRDKPPKPPSYAQAALKNNVNQAHYCQSVKALLGDKNYAVLLITYGINVGVFYAISTLLNQVVRSYFPQEEVLIGWMGLTIVLSGMLGSVVCGMILDATHRFRETTIAIYVLTLIGMIIFSGSLLLNHIWIVFIVAAFLGFFMTGYLPVGFEFAAEITYPEPEGTSSGLLNASAQVFGIAFTMGASAALERFGVLPANIGLTCTLVVGTIMTALIRSELKRQKASQAPLTSDSSPDGSATMAA